MRPRRIEKFNFNWKMIFSANRRAIFIIYIIRMTVDTRAHDNKVRISLLASHFLAGFFFNHSRSSSIFVWDDEDDAVWSLFWFLWRNERKIHNFDPHSCVLLTNSIRWMQLWALWAHAISVHVWWRTRISCLMVIYYNFGCFIAIFLVWL